MNERALEFRRLHEAGCFVLPNPWDVGSARLLESLGFSALASTSAGFAWSIGRADTQVMLPEVLAHLRALVAAVELPINADFEGGYAVAPEDVATNVAAAAATGIAGLSIEDSTNDAAHPLFDLTLAVERIAAACRALETSGTGVLLTARYEGLRFGRTDVGEAIERLTAYAAAGAECLYAPGLRAREDIVAVVKAVAPKPVNLLVGSDFTTLSKAAALGVRRISVGGGLARAAWAGFFSAAREIADQGTFTNLSRAIPFDEIDRSFPPPER